MRQFLQETNHVHDGIQQVYKFENGWGASVIKHSFSYGGSDGLYELAVLDTTGDLCYTTDITDDVLGYLEWKDVVHTLERIQKL